MEAFSLRTVVLNSSQLNQQSYCRDVSRWWSSADPRTHTWSTWTLSACSPAWVCGCYSGCLGFCCWSEGSYLQPISSGWSPVALRLSEILPTVGAIKLQIKGAKHERGDSSLKCGWSGSTSFMSWNSTYVWGTVPEEIFLVLYVESFHAGTSLFVLEEKSWGVTNISHTIWWVECKAEWRQWFN